MSRLSPEEEIARFWSRVDKSGAPHPRLGTPCWIWTGARANGYGYLMFLGVCGGAHRASLVLSRGGRPLPRGLYALHHCDNPPCVNPAHLYAGTAADNVRDMVERGRNRKSRRTP